MNEEDLIANLDVYIRELLEVNKDINKQLQAYKDKEDKLREHCNHYLNDLLIIEVDKIPLQIVLQILNEGSDK